MYTETLYFNVTFAQNYFVIVDNSFKEMYPQYYMHSDVFSMIKYLITQ